jgi:hypothetical protein
MKKKFCKLLILAGILIAFPGCSFVGVARGGLCAASLLFFFVAFTVLLLAGNSEKKTLS